MAKFAPEVLEDSGKIRLGRTQSEAQEAIDALLMRVETDERNRQTWVDRCKAYYLRRYCRLFRHTDYPWPNASDIVIPTIDMTIDRLKSTFSRVIFTRPMVTFEARKPDDFQRARTAELYFNWLLTSGMPDLREQILVGLDSILQSGMGIFKVYWHTQTRVARRVFRPADLPMQYADILPGVVRSEADKLFTQEPASRFDRNAGRRIADNALEALKPRLALDFGLDLEDDDDKQALQSMLRAVKSGKEQVVYTTREYEYNGPRVAAIDPMDFIVPTTACGLQDSPRVVHRLWLSPSTLKQRARDHGWSSKAVDQILETRDEGRQRHQATMARTVYDYEREFREGIFSTHEDDLVEVWEIYWKRDINRDGVDERIVGVFHPHTRSVLKDPRIVPFEHGKYPFVQVKFETNDPRFYSSRGVPEKLDDIDIEITKRHRNKLNNMDMMVPTFTYRFGSELNPDAIRWRPGDFYPVVNHDDLQAIQVPDRTAPDEREENYLFTLIQRYLGGLDTGIVDQQNLSEARTATEIQAIQRTASENLSYKALVFQFKFRELYNMVWDVDNQWRDRRRAIWIRVTGEEPIKLTKEQIQGDYEIIPVGTLETTDPVLEKQAALARYQLLLQLASLPPGALGFEYEPKPLEALKRYYDRDNQMDSAAILRRRTPEEIQQLQQMAQRDAELERRARVNEPLAEDEMRELVMKAEKVMPHGGRQKVVPGARRGA